MEPVLSWMAGFHPEKTPESFTLHINDVAMDTKVISLLCFKSKYEFQLTFRIS